MKWIHAMGLPTVVLAASLVAPGVMAQSYLHKSVPPGSGGAGCAATFQQAEGEIEKAGRPIKEAGLLPRSDTSSESYVTGYLGWINMADCQGDVLIEMDDNCNVTDVYTQGNCPLPHRGLTQ